MGCPQLYGHPQINPQNGASYPIFTVTQAGYQFPVGKMTGEKAVAHQIAFIQAFDAVASHLKQHRSHFGLVAYRDKLPESHRPNFELTFYPRYTLKRGMGELSLLCPSAGSLFRRFELLAPREYR